MPHLPNSLTLLPYFTFLASSLRFDSSSLSSILPSLSCCPCLSPFLHSFHSFIHMIPSSIRFVPSLTSNFPSFSRFPFLVFLSFILGSLLMLACLLHFRSLAAFTFAHSLPVLLLACCLYFCLLAAFTFARLLWLNFCADSSNGLQLTVRAFTCILAFV